MNILPVPPASPQEKILDTLADIRRATERPTETKTQILDILVSIEYFISVANSEFRLAYNSEG